MFQKQVHKNSKNKQLKAYNTSSQTTKRIRCNHNNQWWSFIISLITIEYIHINLFLHVNWYLIPKLLTAQRCSNEKPWNQSWFEAKVLSLRWNQKFLFIKFLFIAVWYGAAICLIITLTQYHRENLKMWHGLLDQTLPQALKQAVFWKLMSSDPYQFKRV